MLPPLIMTSTTRAAIYFSLSVILFCLALVYALTPIFEMQKQFEYSPGTEGTTYVAQTSIPQKPTFKGTEVIGSMYKLDFNGVTVNVEGRVFKEPADVLAHAQSINTDANYQQFLDIDSNGNISKITYLVTR